MRNATHNFDTKAIVAAVVRGVDLGTQRIVLTVQNNVKISISGEGSGVRYPGSLRRSSRPGEPPAKQRGHLSRSWQTGRPQRIKNGRQVGWRVGSNLPYARILEFGSRLIKERPYVRPALKSIESQAVKIIEDSVRSEWRRMRLRPPAKT